MSRVSVALLAFCLSAQTFSQTITQTVQAGPGVNLIGIELKVGDNRLIDLFPNAPVGTLIFKFDNSSGWSASQMYSFGWSHPNLRIVPWEGAIMMLPGNTELNVTLTGEVVPLPLPDYVIMNSGPGAHVYRGYNLIAAKLARHIAQRAQYTATVFVWNRSLSSYQAVMIDSLSGGVVPPLIPSTGGVWYHTTQTPVAPLHPAGTFANTNIAVYFNNYAPALNVDAPILTPNCEHREGLIATLVEISPGGGGAVTPVLPSIPFSTAMPGYLEPTANHIRYVRPDRSLAVQYAKEQMSGITDPFNAPQTAGSNPPTWPAALALNRTAPVFRTQPNDASYRPGETVELRTIFHYPNVLDPHVSLDLPYQWQKQGASPGSWVDVPGATNATLRIENAQNEHAGNYRLRATFNCEDFFSRVAAVTVTAPTLSLQSQDSGQKQLNIAFPVATRAKVQVSTDLETWVDYSEITTATTEWSVVVTAEGSARFFRVVEVP